MVARPVLSVAAQEFGKDVLVEVVVAQLNWCRVTFALSKKDGHQFVILRQQFFVGVDIDYFYLKPVVGQEAMQCLKHVVAQMTIRSGI